MQDGIGTKVKNLIDEAQLRLAENISKDMILMFGDLMEGII